MIINHHKQSIWLGSFFQRLLSLDIFREGAVLHASLLCNGKKTSLAASRLWLETSPTRQSLGECHGTFNLPELQFPISSGPCQKVVTKLNRNI